MEGMLLPVGTAQVKSMIAGNEQLELFECTILERLIKDDTHFMIKRSIKEY